MKITISGEPGSGKSTIAKLLAQKLNYKHMSSGDFMRQMAEERGVTLLELSQQAEHDDAIDKEIDERTTQLGAEQDDFVMDSRLAFHFIPDAVKLFLTVDPNEAARRIFEQKREDEKTNVTLEQTKANIAARIASERKRYQAYYGFDYFDQSNYDLVVDTTGKNLEQVCDEILAFLREKGKI